MRHGRWWPREVGWLRILLWRLLETSWWHIEPRGHEALGWPSIPCILWRWSSRQATGGRCERSGWWGRRSCLSWRGDVLVVAVGLSKTCRHVRHPLGHGLGCAHSRKASRRSNSCRDSGRGWLNTMGFCLSSQHSLCLVTVPFALAVFLVGILYGDVFVHQILTVHVGNGVV